MAFFWQQTLNGLVLGAVYALFALGFSLVLANLRIFHVAHEGVFAWGAIAAYFATDRLGLPFAVGLLLAVVAGGTLNAVLYVVALRRLVNRPRSDLQGFVASIGALIVLIQLGEIVLSRRTVRLPMDAFPVTTWDVGVVRISSIQLLIVVLTIMSVVFLRWLMERTQLGREITTVAYDRELASLLGINSDRVTLIVFFLSGAFAAVAAVLLAVAFNVISATMGAAFVVLAVAITVVGGFGSVQGTFVAGIIVGLASSYTTAYITSAYREVVIFALMLGFLILRPSGLFKVPQVEARA